MDKFQSAIILQKALPHVLLTILLTSCTSDTAHHFSNSSLKMAHYTTILNYQTHRLADATYKNSSEVNFEYEEIITE